MNPQTQQTPKKKASRTLVTVLGLLIGLAAAAAAVRLIGRPSPEAPAPAASTPAPQAAPQAAAPAVEAEPVPPAEPAPVDPAVQRVIDAGALVDKAAARYKTLKGYQAVFDTTEMNEKGEWENETAFMRFEKPFTLMFNYTAGKKKGMQLLYAQDKFNDDIHVRMPGFMFKMIPLISISPDDPRVTGKNKHSIRSAGVGHFIEEFEESFREAERAGKLRILEIGEVEVRGEKGLLIDVDYGMPYEYPRTSVAFSKRTGLPLEVKLYRNQTDLVESYRYLGLVVNPAPDDAEFVASTDPRIVEKFLAASK